MSAVKSITKNYHHMKRKMSIKLFVIIVTFIVILWHINSYVPNCSLQSYITSDSSSTARKSEDLNFEKWQIPEWVLRFNVSHLFDWTWHKNGDYERCRANFGQPLSYSACKARSSIVVNDVVDYFRSNSNEGCIVDNVLRLPNTMPHPLPRARSLTDTCSALRIENTWSLCNKPRSELDNWLPSTKRFVTVAIFNAFVDTGSCHPDVPGTIFTPRATFHFQSWTNKHCNNDAITNIPQIKDEYRHTELIDSLGNYFEAPGHFPPQQLPRLIRLLATTPRNAKVLVAKGGVADALIDVLIERGVVTRDRVIPFDKNMRPNYFANIVYRSESWPYLRQQGGSHYIHDRTDMQLVHRVMAAGDPLVANKRDRIILIKRKVGGSRSIIEHSTLFEYMISSLNKSTLQSKLHIEIFEAQGHIRDHIALFRRARIIVGPHGAGMMNILWSSPKTHVIEIGYSTGMTFPEMYAEMSLHLEQHYWICKGYGDYTAPIHIDMNDFMYIFSKIIHDVEKEEINF